MTVLCTIDDSYLACNGSFSLGLLVYAVGELLSGSVGLSSSPGAGRAVECPGRTSICGVSKSDSGCLGPMSAETN